MFLYIYKYIHIERDRDGGEGFPYKKANCGIIKKDLLMVVVNGNVRRGWGDDRGEVGGI